MMIGFSDCLKRERDISIQAMSSGGKMAFRCNPPLKIRNIRNIKIGNIRLMRLKLLFKFVEQT